MRWWANELKKKYGKIKKNIQSIHFTLIITASINIYIYIHIYIYIYASVNLCEYFWLGLVWFGFVSWHINYRKLLNAKSILYI